THRADIRQILEHIGVDTEPPHITPARGPPLWDECDAQAAEGVEPAPAWDEATQPAPDFEVDQRVRW
ncbi:IS91 family transposase, partial [Campylobacter jejuni]|nr:IS91 family transposase [Campylobacter jejuni]